MEREKEILNKIHEKGKELDIPSGLAPEWMQETLKEHERKQYFRKGRLYPALAAAASFCLIAGLLLHVASLGFLSANNYEAELSILPQGELMNPLNQQGKTAPSKSLEEEKIGRAHV